MTGTKIDGHSRPGIQQRTAAESDGIQRDTHFPCTAKLPCDIFLAAVFLPHPADCIKQCAAPGQRRQPKQGVQSPEGLSLMTADPVGKQGADASDEDIQKRKRQPQLCGDPKRKGQKGCPLLNQ